MPKYTNSDMLQSIEEHIHSERDRAILKRKLIDNMSYETIAREFDLSSVHVGRIIRKARKELYIV